MTEQFRVRVRARLARARKEGLVRTALGLVGRTVSAVVGLVLLPVALCLHIAGFRRLTVIVERIGHLAAEPDSFLKARALNRVPPGRYFMLAARGSVANVAMLEYWKRLIPVVESPAACWVLRALSLWGLMKYDMSRYVLRLNASQEIYPINAEWRGRAPLLAISDADREWSDARFLELGLPRGAWHVCVHVREAGFSPGDEAVHAHRNADPRAVQPAMAEIVRRGGWCVRMGDPSMTRLAPAQGVIDYAHHPLRGRRLDVALCARARFFLGNTSGLALVSSVFGVPGALANMIPTSILGVLASDISIPKLLRARDGRFLSFAEALSSEMGDFRYAELYARAGLTTVENTSEEILELVREMLDRLDGARNLKPEDEMLQRRFLALLRPGHYSYGAASTVAAAFLRRHNDLLPG